MDKDRIRLLTRIAIHEKRYNKQDIKMNQYYRNDYIYKKNFINRIGIFIGLFLIFLLVVLDMVYIKQVDITTLDYKSLGLKFVIIGFIICAVYTIIGIFKYGKEYDESQKRYKQYFLMLNILDKRLTPNPKRKRAKREIEKHEL